MNKVPNMLRINLLLCLLMSLPLISCKGPFADIDYTRPIATDHNVREIHSLELKEAKPDEEKPDESSQSPTAPEPPETLDLTIEQCRALALANNLDLKVALINPTIARQNITAAEARFESLFSADFAYAITDSPSVDLTTGTQTDSRSVLPRFTLPLRTGGTIDLSMPINRFDTDNEFSTAFTPSYTADFAASLSQPLLRDAGLRVNTYAIRVAKYDDQIVQSQTKLSIINILAQVERIYWLNAALRANLKVRQQEYDLAVQQLERARRQVDAGVASEVEIIRAEAGVAERVEGIILAQADLDDSERDLKRLLNIPGVTLDSPTIINTVTPPSTMQYEINPQQLADQAINDRMEMLELEIQLARNMSTIELAENHLLPRADFRYTYNKNGLGLDFDSAFDTLTNRSFDDHRLGLHIEVPLGNEAAKSELRRARAVRMQRLATRDQRKLTIEQEVYQAIATIKSTWQRVVANRRSTILNDRNYNAEVRQFDLGLRTSTDVLNAQTQLANARSAEIRAIAEYQIAQVNLAAATGNLMGAAMIRWDPTELPENN